MEKGHRSTRKLTTRKMKNDSEKRPECQMRRTLKRAHAPLRLATSDNADSASNPTEKPNARESSTLLDASRTLVRVCREAKLSRKLARYIYFLGNEPKLEALRKAGNRPGSSWNNGRQGPYTLSDPPQRETRASSYPRSIVSIRDPPSSLVQREIIIVGTNVR